MKTPEEIKKGLECCCDACAYVCPYWNVPIESRDAGETCEMILARDALACIQQLEAQVPRWIPVKERLPEQGINVPVIFSDGFVGIGQWLGWGWCGYVYRTTNNVTHWMPLPDPPKEE